MNIDLTGWEKLESEEHLCRLYPLPKYGHYRPQPYYEPDRYPCWYKEIAVIDRWNGPDEAVLAYLYEVQ